MSKRGIDFEALSERFLSEIAEPLVSRLTDEVAASAFFLAPWRTGYLAQSIVKDVNGLQATVKPLAPYAPFVINGTLPHEIRPVRASVLRFEAGGQVVFSALVHHPGTKPNPFLQKAAAQASEKIPEIFSNLVQIVTGE